MHFTHEQIGILKDIPRTLGKHTEFRWRTPLLTASVLMIDGLLIFGFSIYAIEQFLREGVVKLGFFTGIFGGTLFMLLGYFIMKPHREFKENMYAVSRLKRVMRKELGIKSRWKW